MKISETIHQCINEKGECVTGGAVYTEPRVSVGHNCSLPDCHCSDGYWMCIGFGMDETMCVRVITVKFDSKEEMDKCLTI